MCKQINKNLFYISILIILMAGGCKEQNTTLIKNTPNKLKFYKINYLENQMNLGINNDFTFHLDSLGINNKYIRIYFSLDNEKGPIQNVIKLNKTKKQLISIYNFQRDTNGSFITELYETRKPPKIDTIILDTIHFKTYRILSGNSPSLIGYGINDENHNEIISLNEKDNFTTCKTPFYVNNIVPEEKEDLIVLSKKDSVFTIFYKDILDYCSNN